MKENLLKIINHYGVLPQYFIRGGNIYHCNAYIHNPCLQLKDIKTGELKVAVIDSLLSQEFKKLCEVDSLGAIKPVEHINLEDE